MYIAPQVQESLAPGLVPQQLRDLLRGEARSVVQMLRRGEGSAV